MSTAKPATGTTESPDTMMLDVTAPEYLYVPVEAQATSLSLAKKKKERTVKPSTEKTGTSKATRAKKQPAAEPSSAPTPSSPRIDISTTNEVITMDHDHPSGDSNGSVSSPASITTPAVIQPLVSESWVATKPERPFHEYSPREVFAAAVITLLIPRAENPAYDPSIIICRPRVNTP